MKYLKFGLALLIVSTGLMVLLSACEDEPVEPQDKELPKISKISPSITHQAYNFGDTAFFKIKFSDNHLLISASLRLYLNTDEQIMLITKTPNSDTASIDTFVVMNDLRFSDLNFELKAVDMAGNVALQSSHIHLR